MGHVSVYDEDYEHSKPVPSWAVGPGESLQPAPRIWVNEHTEDYGLEDPDWRPDSVEIEALRQLGWHRLGRA